MPNDETATPHQPRGQPGRCPICGRDSLPRFRPFCSKRCADVDLGRWLGGRYAIPGEPAEGYEPPADGGSAESDDSD
jgi:endogenous inhibitor of DNA gyrase (YacG/DUF329 family)